MTLRDRIRSAFVRRPVADAAPAPAPRAIPRTTMRSDSWIEPGIGLGGVNDRVKRAVPGAYAPLSIMAVDALMATNNLARRICSIEAEDSLRNWFTIEDLPPSLTDALSEEFDRLNTFERMIGARRDALAHGGAVLFADFDDGQDPSMPVNWTALRTIRKIRTVDRWAASPLSREVSPMGDGPVALWLISLPEGNTIKVHGSRVIVFDGVPQSERARYSLDGQGIWGTSILDATLDEIKGFQITVAMAANVVTSLSQGVYKIRGLYDSMMAGRHDDVRERLEALRYSTGLLGELAIDAEHDDYSIIGRGATGIGDVLEAVKAGLVASTGIPRLKLFREAPAGLGSAGGAVSEISEWDDQITSAQSYYYAPKLRTLSKWVLSQSHVLARAGEAEAPKRIVVEFPSLRSPTPSEAATQRLQAAQARQIDTASGVISTDDARLDPAVSEAYPGINLAEPAPSAGGMVDPNGAPLAPEAPIEDADPSDIPDGEALISMRDAAERLGTGPGAIRGMASRGEIQAWRVGTRYRVAWSQVRAAVRGGIVEPDPIIVTPEVP